MSNKKIASIGIVAAILVIAIRIFLHLDDKLSFSININELEATFGYIAFWIIFCIVGRKNIRLLKLSRVVSAITLAGAIAILVIRPLLSGHGCVTSALSGLIYILTMILAEPMICTLSGIRYLDFLNDFYMVKGNVLYVMTAIAVVWYLYSALAVRKLKKKDSV